MLKILGRCARRYRAGEDKAIWNHSAFIDVPENVILTSPAFAEGDRIPQRFAGRGVGDNISPPLVWASIGVKPKEVILLIEDPDALMPKPVIHLLAMNISPNRSGFSEGELNLQSRSEIVFGRGSFGRFGYAGPRAFPGHGAHHYSFELLLLDQAFGFSENARIDSVIDTITGHVIGRGRLIGTFER